MSAPSPWRVVSPATDSHAYDVVDAEGRLLHKGFWGGEAESRLFAAAPELLAACRELLAAGQQWVDSDDDIANMLRFGRAEGAAAAAIEKAEARHG